MTAAQASLDVPLPPRRHREAALAATRPAADSWAVRDPVPLREFGAPHKPAFQAAGSRARLRTPAMEHGWTWERSNSDRFFIANDKYRSLLQ